jgi:hypothetical protein
LTLVLIIATPFIVSALQVNNVTELKQLNIVSEVSTADSATRDVTSTTAISQSSQINSNSEISSSTVATTNKATEVTTSSATAENSTNKKVEKVTKPESNTTVKNVPSGHGFKSYTNYKLLRADSQQGRLQKLAYSDENGLRKVGEYYCVALGTYYGTTIGDCYIVTLSSGSKFKMTLCDVKADVHTDRNNQYTVVNGCMTEFYVDYSNFNSRAKRAGTISVIAGFEGDVVSIEKLEGINVFNL